MEANDGFLRLIEAEGEAQGIDVTPFLLNPSFQVLRDLAGTGSRDEPKESGGSSDRAPAEPVYRGFVTLGRMDAEAASVRGAVYVRGGTFLLVAEHDVEDLETLSKEMIAITERMAQAQRELVRAKKALERREKKLQELASTDPLTGLSNRRRLDERLAEEIERSKRVGTPLSVVMLDLDRFKEFNDRWGHLCGDTSLRVLAEILESHSRPYDTAARFGGEEFVLVLPGADLEAATDRAESMRRAIAEADLAGADERVTASFGVAAYLGDSADDLLQNADRALYAAKDAGRNCVRVADAQR